MLLSLYQGRKKHFITAHRYYDLGAVKQPGLWIMAGAKFEL